MSTEVFVGPLWTDAQGNVHERHPDTPGIARCGVAMEFGSHNLFVRRGCGDCVAQSIDEYARRHSCKDSGCGADTVFHY